MSNLFLLALLRSCYILKLSQMSERMQINSVQAWVETHGGEPFPGSDLKQSLRTWPIRGIDCDTGNPEAARQGERFIDVNLSFCQQHPEEFQGTYEAGLVPQIMEKSAEKDLVVDFHGRRGSLDNIYVGPEVYPYVLGFVALTGIDTIFVSEAGIHGKLATSLLIDVSEQSERNDVDYWRSMLLRVMEEGLPSPRFDGLTIYAHTNLTPAERYKIGAMHKVFGALDEVPGAAELLGVKGLVYNVDESDESNEGPIEVITPLDLEFITGTDILHLPPLRALSQITTPMS